LMSRLQQQREGAEDGQVVMADTRQCPSWRLVWCYEHVFKRENCEEVAHLTKLAGQCGGTLTCVKQACKLEETLSRSKDRIPFVLMTDFRGLIPCLNILKSNTLLDSPLQIFVLCQLYRQVVKAMARTSQWVDACMPNGNCFEATLKSATSAWQDSMMTGVWPSGVPMAAKALPASCNPKPRECCRYISCETDARAQGTQQESTITTLTVDNKRTTCNHGSFRQDPILMHTEHVTSSMPLDCFINRLLLTTDSNDLKAMLEDAMPMVYMD